MQTVEYRRVYCHQAPRPFAGYQCDGYDHTKWIVILLVKRSLRDTRIKVSIVMLVEKNYALLFQ